MLELDGSAGGGQLIRTALSLAAVTGRGFTMAGIRERRPTPGLRPQHLAAVRVLADVTNADVDGATEGSTRLVFEPREVHAGQYEIDVGTAGSLPLLFDALLPLAVVLDGPLVLTATGGTDVRWAPCMDYLRHVKLPLLRHHGLPAAVDVQRRGFYPAGGGQATLSVGPATLHPLELDPPGAVSEARLYSVATADLADRDVAVRQATAAAERLDDHGVTVGSRSVGQVKANSTGSAIVAAVTGTRIAIGGDALGERGSPAETVGERAVEAVAETLDAGAAVDRPLADQLLPYLALGGGRVRAPGVSEHIETNRDVLEAFDYAVSVDREVDGVRLSG